MCVGTRVFRPEDSLRLCSSGFFHLLVLLRQSQWPGTTIGQQALRSCLPLPPQGWNYRSVLPHQSFCFFLSLSTRYVLFNKCLHVLQQYLFSCPCSAAPWRGSRKGTLNIDDNSRLPCLVRKLDNLSLSFC